MRKELKARGIHGVKVLYSKEQPVDVSGKRDRRRKREQKVAAREYSLRRGGRASDRRRGSPGNHWMGRKIGSNGFI